MNGVGKNVPRSTNIYETFQPFYKVLKMFGFFPFTVELSRKQHIRPSTTLFDAGLLGLWISLHSFLFGLNWLLGDQEPEAESSLIVKHGWHKIYLMQTATSLFAVAHNFVNRHSIVECLRLINQFDLVERTFDHQVKHFQTFSFRFPSIFLFFKLGQPSIDHTWHRSLTARSLMLSAFWAAFLGTVGLFNLTEDQRDLRHFTALAIYIPIVSLSTLVAHQFVFFSFCIETRFKVLLKNIEHKAHLQRMMKSGLLEAYQIQYTMLFEATNRVNGTYSSQVCRCSFKGTFTSDSILQIVPATMSALMKVVIFFFSVIRLFLRKAATFEVYFLAFSNLVWSVPDVSLLLIGIYISAKINNTVRCQMNYYLGEGRESGGLG